MMDNIRPEAPKDIDQADVTVIERLNQIIALDETALYDEEL